VKVWLDDVRAAPDGWVRARTAAETVALLESSAVEELSLDHDLGAVDENGREQTGYDVLAWIEERVALHGFVPPKLVVHSANPAAHERMIRAIEAIDRLAPRN
jgi:hypothetical protein